MPDILIAEDDPVTLSLLETFLTKNGFIVTTTMNGDDAIELATAKTYDLIISDIQMPGSEGIEVISSIIDQEPDTKIIAISSLESTGSYTSFLELAKTVGASATLKKPFDAQTLLDTIESIGIRIPNNNTN